jgi:hypothetical protein
MDYSSGAGAQVRLWSQTLRAEWERFDMSALDKAEMISVGVMWTFL